MNLDECIDASIAMLQSFHTITSSEILARLRDLEDLYKLIEYNIKYAKRGRMRIDKVKNKDELIAIRCSIEGCEAPMPFLNIRAGIPDNGTDWRCLNHIPKEITFPIGLWGEEWIRTGRKVPKDPRDG